MTRSSAWRLPIVLAATFSFLCVHDPRSAGAQTLPYGSDVRVADHPGDLPFAIEVVESNDTVVVADLYSGLFYSMPKTNISAEPTTLIGPLGSAKYTGLAWRDDDPNVLYWIVDDGAGPLLVTSDFFGELIDSAALDLDALSLDVEAVPGEMTWNLETDSFWVAELANDIYFELSDGGVATGEFFPSPALGDFGGGAYGTGIAAVPTAEGEPVRFDIPVGEPVDLRAARVMRVFGAGTSLGAEFGLSYPLNADNELDGWVTGVAWTAGGSSNSGAPAFTPFETEYLCNLSANELVEIQIRNPASRSVIGLTATADSANNVALSWTNPITYTTLRIERKLVDSLAFTQIATFGPPSANVPTSYDDENLENGSYDYRITVTPPSGVSPPSSLVQVTVGPGTLLNAVAHEGTNPLGITLVESENEVVVADLTSGLAYRYRRDLSFIGSLSAPFDAGTNTTGIAWNADSDTLFWYNDSDQSLQETSLAGIPIGDPVDLESPLGGAMGDISYDPNNDSFWGVDISFNAYFEFFADGTIGSVLTDVGGATPIEIGNGVSVVADDFATLLDIPAGTQAQGKVDRVRRFVINKENASESSEFRVGPSTRSGFVNGVESTQTGSLDPPNKAIYVVGNDTNAIYELNLESGVLPNFFRGDCNLDEATDISDVTFLLFHLFDSDFGPEPGCFDACDYNDDGALDIADATYLLAYFFTSGDAPPEPFDDCGTDNQESEEDNLECAVEPCEP